MLIRMYYSATDVLIDYENRKVCLKVLAEDEFYDSESYNAFAEKVVVSLRYSDLKIFLKSCIVYNNRRLQYHYPFLTATFYKYYQPAIKNSTLDVLISRIFRANHIKSRDFEIA